MGIFDKLFGSKPNPPRLEGDVLYMTGPTGMLQTTDKRALSFRVEDCDGFVPRERQRVSISRVEGVSALGLALLVDAPAFAARPVPEALRQTAEQRAATLNWTSIEQAYGAAPGPLLRALVELCFRLDPVSPANALG